MDNGNKIRINKPEVKLFLHGDLLPANAVAPVKYNLVDEYAKTKSKKVSFIFVVLALCVIIVSALTVGLVRFLQERNNSLEVDINVFDDLNLKNLLDVVSRTQASLDQASQEKNQLELELSTKLAQAEVMRDSELQLLNSLNISDSEKSQQRAEIFQNYEASVVALNSEFQPQITLLEAQMDDYTEQLASFDSSNVELAQEQEAAINSQRQAFELEKQELVASYDKLVAELVAELESLQAMQLETQAQTLSVLSEQHEAEINVFDPVFSDPRANAIVEKYRNYTETEESMGSSIVLSDEGVQNNVEAMLLSISDAYSDLNHVVAITSTVPWSNSLTEYIQTLSKMANQIGDDILSSSAEIFQAQDAVLEEVKLELAAREQELGQMLIEDEAQRLHLADLQSKFDSLQVEFAVIQEKILTYEEEVLSYEEIMLNYETRVLDYEEIVHAFDDRAKQNGDDGYILNTTEKEEIRVYISSLFEDSVQDGTRAFVLRSGNLLGMVTLYRRGNIFYAQPDEGVGELLRVNDALLIEFTE